MNKLPYPIDPAAMPAFTLRSGAKIPAIGFGTFGSDHVTNNEMANAVETAIRLGCRHIDCAAVYGNEKEIGATLHKLFREGVVTRGEMFITSKVWNDHHGFGDVLLSCAQSLKDLQLDYLDLLLIHWPFPNFHPPKCTVASRAADAKPYIHADFMKTYRQLERVAQMGLTRHIGVSNVTVSKLESILHDCRLQPDVNEMELHPHFQQPALYEFSRSRGITNIGYCPLGSPNRPDRDKTADDTVDMEDPVIVEIACNHNIHPAGVCLKWAVQRGHCAIPTSRSINNIAANLHAACSAPLTDDEMAAIAEIDRECRLIKGQVFLWPEAKDWTDLWDE